MTRGTGGGRAALCMLCALFAASRASADAPLSRTESVLWTTCTITLYDHAEKRFLDECFRRLHDIDRRISTNSPGSELDAIAAQAGQKPVRVSDEILFVTRKALQLSRLSHGLFDPTVGPLIEVWKINKEHPEVPAPAAIAAARALVDWKDVVINDSQKTIFLRRRGMHLDLGGLAKGYAADEVVKILERRGVTSAIIDLGGDIFAMGHGRDGQAWRIGVQNPDAARGIALGIADVVNQSVVTSGVYEHFFEKNGRRYHHIMDTRTGYPVDNGLVSVTVVTGSSMDADGLALAIFCLGKEKGLELGRRLGLMVVMVDSDRRVSVTPGTRKIFTITDGSFTYAE